MAPKRHHMSFTFAMIKPTAFAEGHSGSIISNISDHGFRITAMKLTRMTELMAANFYNIHLGKDFFPSLIKYMSSGPVVAMILQKDNAVNDFRHLIGSTDPAKANQGTIRQLFGKSIQHNAIHGSDSDENAVIEAGFFFDESEKYT